jgi:hypothetical protein
MRNRATHGNSGMYRTIIGDEVPRLCHSLGVKCIPNYPHVHIDAGKDLRVGVALVSSNPDNGIAGRVGVGVDRYYGVSGWYIARVPPTCLRIGADWVSGRSLNMTESVWGIAFMVSENGVAP